MNRASLTTSTRTISGDQALAHGALEAGVRLITSYPGSPSSGTVDALIAVAERYDLYVEWSANEKVAAEMAIGASIAGRRAIVATKSVGFNVMLDPLMALNLTPVNGGLVILLGDDPGGYGSQNDQDSRHLGPMLKMPMMEPATPAEARDMMRQAFELSERLQTAVIIRETRSFSLASEEVDWPEPSLAQPNRGLISSPWRYVPVPRNVVAKHRELNERIVEFTKWANESTYNAITGDGPIGIIAAGFAHGKVTDVIGDACPRDLRVLKLGALYPLPDQLVARFLDGCAGVLVLEENEPYLETQIKAVAYDRNRTATIFGKASGHVSGEGELFRWQIVDAIRKIVPHFAPAREYRAENEAAERPIRENHCAGCRYDEILDVFDAAAAEAGVEPVLCGDPGCLATVGQRLTAKYAIGSAVGLADGMRKAGLDRRAIALFGDSSFFHTSLPAVCNAAVNGSDILMIVLDNGSTVTSGFQPNPSVGRDALGRPAPKLDIEAVARACGVKYVRSIGPDFDKPALQALFRGGLSHPGLGLLVVRSRCDGPA